MMDVIEDMIILSEHRIDFSKALDLEKAISY
ncbi:MAG: hypothetical protein ACI93S_000280 [Ancylomarina sp.]|jgi:hypothetical protein